MKKLRVVTLAVLFTALLFNTSCVVLVKEGGPRHKGWNKNTNNPHNIYSTNPGKQKGKSKK